MSVRDHRTEIEVGLKNRVILSLFIESRKTPLNTGIITAITFYTRVTPLRGTVEVFLTEETPVFSLFSEKKENKKSIEGLMKLIVLADS